MARTKSPDSKDYRLPLQTVYNVNVHCHEEDIPSLALSCERFCVQAHRSLLPVDPDTKLYSIQLQISSSSVQSAMSIIFDLGVYYGNSIKDFTNHFEVL